MTCEALWTNTSSKKVNRIKLWYTETPKFGYIFSYEKSLDIFPPSTN